MNKDVFAIGSKFERLTVMSIFHRPYKDGHPKIWCQVRCDCGAEFEVLKNSLISGNTKSCGCFKRELDRHRTLSHGQSTHPLYHVWSAMRERCSNPRTKGFKNYGGRGISVCPEWDASFATFYEWAVGSGYQPGLTLDRINVDGDYTPANCRWATRIEQMSNTRINVLITAWGETKTLSEWVRDERCSITYMSLRARLHRGMEPEQAISSPKVQYHPPLVSHCKNGHEYTPENTSVYKNGQRRCLTCHRLQQREHTKTRSIHA